MIFLAVCAGMSYSFKKEGTESAWPCGEQDCSYPGAIAWRGDTSLRAGWGWQRKKQKNPAEQQRIGETAL